MSAETSGDVCHIKDEDVLRKMWQDTEDFGRKKEIRSHMYKLREERLRNFYSDSTENTSTHHNTSIKDGNRPNHAQSLLDHSFLSMKSKEIRDSESPTKDMHQFRLSSDKNANRGWEVVSKNEVSDDGKTHTLSKVATTSGSEKIDKGVANYSAKCEQKASVYEDGDANNFTKSSTAASKSFLQQDAKGGDDNSSYQTHSTSSSSSSKTVTQHRSGSDIKPVPNKDDSSVIVRKTYTTDVPADLKRNPNYIDGNTTVTTETRTLPDGSKVTTTRYETKGISSKIDQHKFHTEQKSKTTYDERQHYQTVKESDNTKNIITQNSKNIPKTDNAISSTVHLQKDYVTRDTHNKNETIRIQNQDERSTRQENRDDFYVTQTIRENEYMPRDHKPTATKTTSKKDDDQVVSTVRTTKIIREGGYTPYEPEPESTPTTRRTTVKDTDDGSTINTIRTTKIVRENEYIPHEQQPMPNTDNTTRTTTVKKNDDGSTVTTVRTTKIVNVDGYTPQEQQPEFVPNTDNATKTTTVKKNDDGSVITTVRTTKIVRKDGYTPLERQPEPTVTKTTSKNVDDSVTTVKTTKIVREDGYSPYEKQPEPRNEKPDCVTSNRRPGDYKPVQSTPGEFTPTLSTPGNQTPVNSKLHEPIRPQEIIITLSTKPVDQPTTNDNQIIRTTYTTEPKSPVKPTTEKITSVTTHTTYKTDYTTKRISVDISPTHDAFARSLRASPDRDQKRGSTRSLKSSTSSLRTSVSPDKKHPDHRDKTSPTKWPSTTKARPDSRESSPTKKSPNQEINTDTITRRRKTDHHTTERKTTHKPHSRSPSPTTSTSDIEYIRKSDIVTDLDDDKTTTTITRTKKPAGTTQRPDTLNFNNKQPSKQSPSPTSKKPTSPNKTPEKPFKRRDTYEERCRQILGISEQTTDVRKTTERTNSRKTLTEPTPRRSPDEKKENTSPKDRKLDTKSPDRKSPEKRIPMTDDSKPKGRKPNQSPERPNKVPHDQYYVTKQVIDSKTTTTKTNKSFPNKPREETFDKRQPVSPSKGRKPTEQEPDDLNVCKRPDGKDKPYSSRPTSKSPDRPYTVNKETDDYYVRRKITEHDVITSKPDKPGTRRHPSPDSTTSKTPRPHHEPHPSNETPDFDRKFPRTVDDIPSDHENYRPGKRPVDDTTNGHTITTTEVTKRTDMYNVTDQLRPDRKSPDRKSPEKTDKQPKGQKPLDKSPQKTRPDSETTNKHFVTNETTIITTTDQLNRRSPEKEPVDKPSQKTQEIIPKEQKPTDKFSPKTTDKYIEPKRQKPFDKVTDERYTTTEDVYDETVSTKTTKSTKKIPERSPERKHPTTQDKSKPRNDRPGEEFPVSEYTDEYCERSPTPTSDRKQPRKEKPIDNTATDKYIEPKTQEPFDKRPKVTDKHYTTTEDVYDKTVSTKTTKSTKKSPEKSPERKHPTTQDKSKPRNDRPGEEFPVSEYTDEYCEGSPTPTSDKKQPRKEKPIDSTATDKYIEPKRQEPFDKRPSKVTDKHYTTTEDIYDKTVSTKTTKSTKKSPEKSPERKHPTTQDKSKPRNDRPGEEFPVSEYTDEYCEGSPTPTSDKKHPKKEKPTDSTDDYYVKKKITEEQFMVTQPPSKTPSKKEPKPVYDDKKPTKHPDVTDQTSKYYVTSTTTTDKKTVKKQLKDYRLSDDSPENTDDDETFDRTKQPSHRTKPNDREPVDDTDDIYYTATSITDKKTTKVDTHVSKSPKTKEEIDRKKPKEPVFNNLETSSDQHPDDVTEDSDEYYATNEVTERKTISSKTPLDKSEKTKPTSRKPHEESPDDTIDDTEEYYTRNKLVTHDTKTITSKTPKPVGKRPSDTFEPKGHKPTDDTDDADVCYVTLKETDQKTTRTRIDHDTSKTKGYKPTDNTDSNRRPVPENYKPTNRKPYEESPDDTIEGTEDFYTKNKIVIKDTKATTTTKTPEPVGKRPSDFSKPKGYKPTDDIDDTDVCYVTSKETDQKTTTTRTDYVPKDSKRRPVPDDYTTTNRKPHKESPDYTIEDTEDFYTKNKVVIKDTKITTSKTPEPVGKRPSDTPKPKGYKPTDDTDSKRRPVSEDYKPTNRKPYEESPDDTIEDTEDFYTKNKLVITDTKFATSKTPEPVGKRPLETSKPKGHKPIYDTDDTNVCYVTSKETDQKTITTRTDHVSKDSKRRPVPEDHKPMNRKPYEESPDDTIEDTEDFYTKNKVVIKDTKTTTSKTPEPVGKRPSDTPKPKGYKPTDDTDSKRRPVLDDHKPTNRVPYEESPDDTIEDTEDFYTKNKLDTKTTTSKTPEPVGKRPSDTSKPKGYQPTDDTDDSDVCYVTSQEIDRKTITARTDKNYTNSKPQRPAPEDYKDTESPYDTIEDTDDYYTTNKTSTTKSPDRASKRPTGTKPIGRKPDYDDEETYDVTDQRKTTTKTIQQTSPKHPHYKANNDMLDDSVEDYYTTNRTTTQKTTMKKTEKTPVAKGPKSTQKYPYDETKPKGPRPTDVTEKRYITNKTTDIKIENAQKRPTDTKPRAGRPIHETPDRYDVTENTQEHYTTTAVKTITAKTGRIPTTYDTKPKGGHKPQEPEERYVTRKTIDHRPKTNIPDTVTKRPKSYDDKPKHRRPENESPDRHYEITVDECYEIDDTGRRPIKKSPEKSPKRKDSSKSPDRSYRVNKETNESHITKTTKKVETHSKPLRQKSPDKAGDSYKPVRKTPDQTKPKTDRQYGTVQEVHVHRYSETRFGKTPKDKTKPTEKPMTTEYVNEYCSLKDKPNKVMPAVISRKPNVPDTTSRKPVQETFTATRTYQTTDKATVHRLDRTNRDSPKKPTHKIPSTETPRRKVKPEDDEDISDDDTLVRQSSREPSLSPDRSRKVPEGEDFYTLNIKVYKTDSNITQRHPKPISDNEDIDSDVDRRTKTSKSLKPKSVEPGKTKPGKPGSTIYRTEEKHYINKSTKPTNKTRTPKRDDSPERRSPVKQVQKITNTRRITNTTDSKYSTRTKPKLEETRHVVTTTIQVVPKSKPQDKKKPTTKTSPKTSKPISQPINKNKPRIPSECERATTEEESDIDEYTVDGEQIDENRPYNRQITHTISDNQVQPESPLRRPDKVITTKSIIINNDFENDQEVIVKLQRSKSSRETTPDRTYVYPASDNEDKGVPRYPDEISEPDDVYKRRKPTKLSDIPIIETEDIDTHKVEETDECLLSVNEKVNKFVNEAVKLSKTQKPDRVSSRPDTKLNVTQDVPKRPKSPKCENYPEDDDETYTSVSKKVSHFIETAEKIKSQQKPSYPAPKVKRPEFTDLDETIKTDDCLLSVSDKVNKFTVTSKTQPDYKKPVSLSKMDEPVSQPRSPIDTTECVQIDSEEDTYSRTPKHRETSPRLYSKTPTETDSTPKSNRKVEPRTILSTTSRLRSTESIRKAKEIFETIAKDQIYKPEQKPQRERTPTNEDFVPRHGVHDKITATKKTDDLKSTRLVMEKVHQRHSPSKDDDIPGYMRPLNRSTRPHSPYVERTHSSTDHSRSPSVEPHRRPHDESLENIPHYMWPLDRAPHEHDHPHHDSREHSPVHREPSPHFKHPERQKTPSRKTEPDVTDKPTKFGTVLHKTDSEKVFSQRRKLTTIELENILTTHEIEEIYDIEILEILLERAVNYEQRRKIRAQIRIVKQLIIDNKLPTILIKKLPKTDRVKEPSVEKCKPSKKVQEQTYTYSERRRSSEVKEFSEINISRKSPDRKPESKKPETKNVFKTELKRVEPVSKKVVEEKPSWVTQRPLKKPSGEAPKSKPLSTTTKKQDSRASPPKERKPIDAITSSYGVGPTDENGSPLFGLKALRAQTKTATTKVQGTVIKSHYYSENGHEPVGEVSVTKYSTDPNDFEGDIVDETGGLVSVTTTKKFGAKGTPTYRAIEDKEDSGEDSHERTTQSTTITRRGSVKQMSKKFIENAVETSKNERQSSYPKAGLILRTSSFKKSTTQDSSREASPEPEVTTTTVRRTVTSSTSGERTDTFLNNQKRVSNVQDVITRMRNADDDVQEGDTVEDAEARKLLNKFIGSQVILSGMESHSSSSPVTTTVKRTTTTTSTSSKGGGKPTVITRTFTHPITQEDLDTIWDEQTLKLLLERSTDYEERRIIRGRLRDVMAEKEVCVDVTKTSEESSGRVEETIEKSKSEGPVTTTQVTRITSQQVSKKPISPFAKFRQLDKQNSRNTPPGTPRTPTGSAPLFKFTDPELSRQASTVKERLLQWCQMKTKEYENVQLDNFSSSWADGLGFCALIHHFLPDAFDYHALTPQDRKHNFTLAFRVADEKANIVPLLDVEDMIATRKPDWKCVFTYVQTIYARFKNED